MVVCSIFSVDVVARAMTGESLMPRIAAFTRAPQVTVDNSFRCSDNKPIAGLEQTRDPQLRKLAEYQQLCHSAVASTVMIFTDMPNSEATAQAAATKMAATLKEFNKYHVTPLVIAEPVTTWGDIDFEEFTAGFYDKWIDAYFKALRAQGITTQQMGIWVPFPEANLPYWNRNNAKPKDFATMVNKYLGAAHKHFPGVQASVMLNSATYDADDFDWANGEYLSLIPYVKDIQKGLVQSFGLQGFPWLPNARQSGPGILDAGEFLNHKLAKEAADTLGVKKIWFNTGTFGLKYADDVGKQVSLDPSRRTDVLNSILAQAQTLKKEGYQISINLFSQNKSQTAEATDWSYFATNTINTSSNSPVFANFAARLHQERIELWLFDRL